MSKEKNCDTCKYEKEKLRDYPCVECRGDIGVCWEPKEPRFQMGDAESAADQFVESANDRQVNHPQHYTSHPSGIQAIEITEHMNFCLGSAMKCLWRADLKRGDGGIEDLNKAAWYINREIERRAND